MATYRLIIPGMVCESSVEAVQRTARNFEGVSAVRSDPPFMAIRVDMAGSGNAANLLVRAIERVGFQVEACDALEIQNV